MGNLLMNLVDCQPFPLLTERATCSPLRPVRRSQRRRLDERRDRIPGSLPAMVNGHPVPINLFLNRGCGNTAFWSRTNRPAAHGSAGRFALPTAYAVRKTSLNLIIPCPDHSGLEGSKKTPRRTTPSKSRRFPVAPDWAKPWRRLLLRGVGF